MRLSNKNRETNKRSQDQLSLNKESEVKMPNSTLEYILISSATSLWLWLKSLIRILTHGSSNLKMVN